MTSPAEASDGLSWHERHDTNMQRVLSRREEGLIGRLRFQYGRAALRHLIPADAEPGGTRPGGRWTPFLHKKKRSGDMGWLRKTIARTGKTQHVTFFRRSGRGTANLSFPGLVGASRVSAEHNPIACSASGHDRTLHVSRPLTREAAGCRSIREVLPIYHRNGHLHTC